MEILHTINLIKSKTTLENVNLDDIEKRTSYASKTPTTTFPFLETEKGNISDKIKKLTNDINLKDLIIKDLKEKYEKIQNNSSIIEIQNKTINNNNTEQKKLKEDLSKKEQLIKTLKHKNFSLSMELKEIQTQQIKQSKNNVSELIKEQEKHSKTKNQLDDYQITLEKMASCLRKIFKDLFIKYDTNEIKKRFKYSK